MNFPAPQKMNKLCLISKIVSASQFSFCICVCKKYKKKIILAYNHSLILFTVCLSAGDVQRLGPGYWSPQHGDVSLVPVKFHGAVQKSIGCISMLKITVKPAYVVTSFK